MVVAREERPSQVQLGGTLPALQGSGGPGWGGAVQGGCTTGERAGGGRGPQACVRGVLWSVGASALGQAHGRITAARRALQSPCPLPAGARPDSQALGCHLLEEVGTTPALVWGLRSPWARALGTAGPVLGGGKTDQQGLRPPPRLLLGLLPHSSYTQKNPPGAALRHREN